MLTKTGEARLREAYDLTMARRLWDQTQRGRTAKSRLRLRKAFEAHLADGGYRAVRWERNPESGKYEMTELVR